MSLGPWRAGPPLIVMFMIQSVFADTSSDPSRLCSSVLATPPVVAGLGGMAHSFHPFDFPSGLAREEM